MLVNTGPPVLALRHVVCINHSHEHLHRCIRDVSKKFVDTPIKCLFNVIVQLVIVLLLNIIENTYSVKFDDKIFTNLKYIL